MRQSDSRAALPGNHSGASNACSAGGDAARVDKGGGDVPKECRFSLVRWQVLVGAQRFFSSVLRP